MDTILLQEPGLTLERPLGPAVVAIGMFDGVHRGHEVVIKEAEAIARGHGVPSAIFTFIDHPRSVLVPDQPVSKLTTWPEKQALLATLGVDFVVGARFTSEFSMLGAEDFVRQVLHEQLQVRHVVVGYNFCFGRGQEGTVESLHALGARYGFDITAVAPVLFDGRAVSSSRIRALLFEGDIQAANAVLGHPYRLSGPVVEGDRRGRLLGFPTANLRLDPEKLVPAFGVYAGQALWGDRAWPCVINLGIRPTFQGTELRVEAHLLDFEGDLYGVEMTLELQHRLRAEQGFGSVDELVQQIRRDALAAQSLLAVPGR